MKDAQSLISGRQAFLQLTALWGMSVAQPLYDLLGKHAEFFVVRRVSPVEILLFALAISLLLPALLGGIFVLLRRRFPATARVYWAVLLFVLLLVLAGLVFKAFGIATWTTLLYSSVAAAAAIEVLYFRWRALRSYLGVLSIAALLFPLNFLGSANVRKLLWDAELGQVAATAPAQPAPVVMLLFDELPLTSLLKSEDEIDEKNFPNFAELARHANWYPNTWSVSADTTIAVPAILTGAIPARGKFPRFQDLPHNLFLLLGRHSKMLVQESITSLCPAEICTAKKRSVGRRAVSLIQDVGILYAHRVVPSDLTPTLPSIDSKWGNFLADAEAAPADGSETIDHPVESFDEFLRNFGDIPAPGSTSLSFFHMLMPHPPWHYFPSGRAYSSAGGSIQMGGLSTDDVWTDDEQSVAQDFLRHMLQLRFTDALLGRMVRELKERGIYDRALIVVVADHGASFRPGRHRRTPMTANFVDVIKVPLLIKLPNQSEGAKDLRIAQTIDVLPTVTDALGLHVPWNLEGRSLLDEPRLDVTKIRYVTPGREVAEKNLKETDIGEALAHKTHLVEKHFSRISASWGAPVEIPPATVPVVGEASCAAWLEAPEVYSLISETSKVLPALLRGEVRCEGLPSGPHEIILTFNGSFAGKKKIELAEAGTQKFSMLVGESLFRLGHNEVQLEVRADNGSLRIPALLNTEPPMVLAKNATGEELLKFPGNRTLSLAPRQVLGMLDTAKLTDGGAYLEGWVFDNAAKKRVNQVAVFCNNRLLTTVPAITRRADVAEVLGSKAAELSGFQAFISLDSCSGEPPQRLRLFGIADDKASEIKYGASYADAKDLKFGA